jgi:hypothetical protein
MQWVCEWEVLRKGREFSPEWRENGKWQKWRQILESRTAGALNADLNNLWLFTTQPPESACSECVCMCVCVRGGIPPPPSSSSRSQKLELSRCVPPTHCLSAPCVPLPTCLGQDDTDVCCSNIIVVRKVDLLMTGESIWNVPEKCMSRIHGGARGCDIVYVAA